MISQSIFDLKMTEGKLVGYSEEEVAQNHAIGLREFGKNVIRLDFVG